MEELHPKTPSNPHSLPPPPPMSRTCVVREGSAVSSLGPLRRPLLDDVDGDSGCCSLRFCTIFKYLFLHEVLISGAIFFVRNKKLLTDIQYYELMNMVKR